MNTDTLLSESEIVAKKRERDIARGLYFLIKGDEIVYVGQSVINIYDRISAHARDEAKDFDSFAILHRDENDLHLLEAAYIFKFAPMYNVAMPSERYLRMGRKLKARFGFSTAPRLTKKLRRLHIYPNRNGYYDTQAIEMVFKKETENDG